MRRLAIALTPLLGALAGISPLQAEQAESPRRTLFILLDAVPFDLVAGLTDGADGERLFEDFAAPAPVISTFPSSTSVATGGLLEPFGIQPSPGYEARFFDWQAGEVRGGGAISYFRIEFPWREFFDWSRKGVARSALASLWPVRASISRVEEAVQQFFAVDDDEFFVYIETTDTAAHLMSPDSLVPVFRELDRVLRAARRRHPKASYRVVLFSDHGIAGGQPLQNAWPLARAALRAAGFDLRDRVEGHRDVALTPFGLVSSFEAYTHPAAVVEVAQLLGSVRGVDLCVYSVEGGRWTVESDRGRARIEEAEGRWSYEIQDGDPLGYAPVLERLVERHPGLDASFPDRWWFEETAEHVYPDALYRLARAFDLVENPASVLCSLEPGFMYGLSSTAFGARLAGGPLRWTHGALFREASWGFLMSDDPAWMANRPLRFTEALLPFSGVQ